MDLFFFSVIAAFVALSSALIDVLQIAGCDDIRVADMSNGKAKDDGYRGAHVYFQLCTYHYPIEIQYNDHYDRAAQ